MHWGKLVPFFKKKQTVRNRRRVLPFHLVRTSACRCLKSLNSKKGLVIRHYILNTFRRIVASGNQRNALQTLILRSSFVCTKALEVGRLAVFLQLLSAEGPFGFKQRSHRAMKAKQKNNHLPENPNINHHDVGLKHKLVPSAHISIIYLAPILLSSHVLHSFGSKKG
jgi:hypothetical protein